MRRNQRGQHEMNDPIAVFNDSHIKAVRKDHTGLGKRRLR